MKKKRWPEKDNKKFFRLWSGTELPKGEEMKKLKEAFPERTAV
jgi:hypothetical protein